MPGRVRVSSLLSLYAACTTWFRCIPTDLEMMRVRSAALPVTVALALTVVCTAELGSIPEWKMTIKKLAELKGNKCSFDIINGCNACIASVNFEFATAPWTGTSFTCINQGPGVIGRCISCLLPNSTIGRLLNIDGDSRCEQIVAKELVERSREQFEDMFTLSRDECADENLSSRYNLLLANAAVAAFRTDKLPSPEPTEEVVDGLPTGALVGIILGSILLVCLCIGGVWFWCKFGVKPPPAKEEATSNDTKGGGQADVGSASGGDNSSMKDSDSNFFTHSDGTIEKLEFIKNIPPITSTIKGTMMYDN